MCGQGLAGAGVATATRHTCGVGRESRPDGLRVAHGVRGLGAERPPGISRLPGRRIGSPASVRRVGGAASTRSAASQPASTSVSAQGRSPVSAVSQLDLSDRKIGVSSSSMEAGVGTTGRSRLAPLACPCASRLARLFGWASSSSCAWPSWCAPRPPGRRRASSGPAGGWPARVRGGRRTPRAPSTSATASSTGSSTSATASSGLLVHLDRLLDLGDGLLGLLVLLDRLLDLGDGLLGLLVLLGRLLGLVGLVGLVLGHRTEGDRRALLLLVRVDAHRLDLVLLVLGQHRLDDVLVVDVVPGRLEGGRLVAGLDALEEAAAHRLRGRPRAGARRRPGAAGAARRR